MNNNQCKTIFIASNHASHTQYAIDAMRHNKEVYLEKPISVSWSQFRDLLSAKKQYNSDLYAGYNRPFSQAVTTIDNHINGNMLPLTISCTVFGHKIPPNHWYRDPDEGTRICGNVGHWLDLAVHLMNNRGAIPELFLITVTYSSRDEFDDNIAISIFTSHKDLLTIVLTAREEPFEGIIEQINLQSGVLSASIFDFRKMILWDGAKKKVINYFPKDVGHKKAINQPWSSKKRSFKEIEVSTVLMLTITDMVRTRQERCEVRPLEILNTIVEQAAL